MGLGCNRTNLFCALRMVQVAGAAAVAAAEAWHGREPLSNGSGNSALQIRSCSGYDCVLEFAMRQEIVDVPSPRLLRPLHNPDMPVYPLQSTWITGGACV